MTQAPGLQPWLAMRRPGCHEQPRPARRRSRRFAGLEAHCMTDPRPFGAHAPTGFARWAIERTRALPDRWASRRLAFVLRRLAIQSLDGRPVDVEALGARMRLYPYNNVCEKRILFTPQFFDPQERAILEVRIGERLHLRRYRGERRRLRALRRRAGGRHGPDPGRRAAAGDLRPARLQYPPEPVRDREGRRLRGGRQGGRADALPRPPQQGRIERQDRRLEPDGRGPRAGGDAARSPQPGRLHRMSTPSSSTSRAPRT